MKVTAKLNNLRISPRKVRLVVDVIRGLGVGDAKVQLNFLIKRSSKPILKLLNSALANAKHNFELDDTYLYISEIYVTEGPTLKRIMPRAMGRAFHIMKRTSHITMVLDEKNNKVDTAEKESVKSIKGDASLKKDKKDSEFTVKKAEKDEVKKKKVIKKVKESK